MHWLIGVHAFLGEIGALASLWVFIEFLRPHKDELGHCKKASLVGFYSTFLSWIIGGYYYVSFYGPNVKPIIKASEMPWAHLIVTELKEHVFLFLPFLSFFLYQYLKQISAEDIKKERVNILLLSLITCILGFSMAFMGYIITTAARVGYGG